MRVCNTAPYSLTQGDTWETAVPAALTRLFAHPVLDWGLQTINQKTLTDREVRVKASALLWLPWTCTMVHVPASCELTHQKHMQASMHTFTMPTHKKQTNIHV